MAYKGPGVIDPHIDGPIAQPAYKRCCNPFQFVSFHFIAQGVKVRTGRESEGVKVFGRRAKYRAQR